jgi:hypothetical protein
MFAPTYRSDKHPLAEELAALDAKRDLLRAQLADEDLLAKTKTARHHEEQWERLAEYRKRQKRRAAEKEAGIVVPPSPWDGDLDEHPPGTTREYELADGYKVRLLRNRFCTWNAYVTLPEGHPFANKEYNFFGMDRPDDLPSAPQELTHKEGNTFGFDHCHFHDIKPYWPHSSLDYGPCNSYEPTKDTRDYRSHYHVKKDAEELADYFRRLAREFAHLA